MSFWNHQTIVIKDVVDTYDNGKNDLDQIPYTEIKQ